MKRRDTWRAILDTRTDVDRMVAAAVGDHPNRAPVRPASGASTTTEVPFQAATWQDLGNTTRAVTEVPDAPATATSGSRSPQITEDERRTLAELSSRVRERIYGLDQTLASERGREEVIKALALYFDERIMVRLPEYLRLGWPLLQTAYTGATTGGDDFYRFVSELRARPTTPSLVFEVYYFCLENGFVGRYANDLASIERYQQWIREAIELPRVPTDSADTAEVSVRTSKAVAGWVVYAVSLAVVVVVAAAQVVLSNYPDSDRNRWANGLVTTDSKVCQSPSQR